MEYYILYTEKWGSISINIRFSVQIIENQKKSRNAAGWFDFEFQSSELPKTLFAQFIRW